VHILDAVTTAYEYQGFWGSFWDIIWWFLWIFFFMAYLFALFAVIGDLFRDHTLNGWGKAVWIIFLIFVPFLTLLVYLIARGNSMAQRSRRPSCRARRTPTSSPWRAPAAPALPTRSPRPRVCWTPARSRRRSTTH
jgi:hypothetical protein